MGRWDDYDRYYPPSTPRSAEGGIKARSQRGSFGKNWWSKRWIAVLEGFHLGDRLTRGRTYARKGQVLSIEIGCGMVTARVQGSRVRPYTVKVKTKTLSTSQWQKVIKIMAAQPVYVAKLLMGEMPAEIERAFEQAGLPLFPERRQDLETSCSCPDWSNPCKHIAAVYYILGEEFDRDPFLLFKLRGLGREELLGQLGQSAPASHEEGLEQAKQTDQSEPVPTYLTAFWAGGPVNIDCPTGESNECAALLPRQLGDFPLWQGKEPILNTLEPIYTRVASQGLAIVLTRRLAAAPSDGDGLS